MIAASLGLVLAVLAVAAWVGVRGLLAKDELDAASRLSGALRQAVADRDAATATAVLAEVGTHARRAAELTGDPVWRMTETVPVAGANLSAVRVVASQLDAVLTDALAPLVDAGTTLSAHARTPDGAVALDEIAALHAPVSHARTVLAEAADQLDAIEADHLIPPVREGATQLAEVVDEMRPAVATIDDISALLPPLLGADGPRTILVALQNNAELRTGGGITGSFVELRAEAGRLSLTAQADSSVFAPHAIEPGSVPASTAAIYGDGVGQFVQNASAAADFALTGQLLSQWWLSATGTSPDAVLSADPIVVRALLGAFGPVSAAGQELSAENLVQALLVTPYMALDGEAQTSLFQETAAAVFTRLTSPDADLVAVAGALAEPVAQGRVSLWSAHADEQEIIARTALAGPAARQAQAGDDAFAVYFNDATAAKMDSFLGVGIQWGVASCRPDGHRDVVVSVTLTNRAPEDAGTALSWDMTGGGFYGTRAGKIATNVAVSAPPGTFLGGVTTNGEAVPAADADDAGFPVAATRVLLKPGESATVDFRFVSAQARDLEPVILHTPLLEQPEISEAPLSCS